MSMYITDGLLWKILIFIKLLCKLIWFNLFYFIYYDVLYTLDIIGFLFYFMLSYFIPSFHLFFFFILFYYTLMWVIILLNPDVLGN